MTPVQLVRRALRRNRVLHRRWERIKHHPAVQKRLLARALAHQRLEQPAVSRDRETIGKVMHAVHAALDRSSLDGHWHLWGGALLGWAREGKLLDFDLKDIDLAIDESSLPALLEATDELLLDGFEIATVFVSNDGTVREFALARDGVRVDLFIFRTVHGFWDNRGFGDRHGRPSELISYLPRQPLEPIELEGLRWPKPVDHNTELTTIYGDWRTPNPLWKFGDDRSVFTVEDWLLSDLPLEAGVLALRAQAAGMS